VKEKTEQEKPEEEALAQVVTTSVDTKANTGSPNANTKNHTVTVPVPPRPILASWPHPCSPPEPGSRPFSFCYPSPPRPVEEDEPLRCEYQVGPLPLSCKECVLGVFVCPQHTTTCGSLRVALRCPFCFRTLCKDHEDCFCTGSEMWRDESKRMRNIGLGSVTSVLSVAGPVGGRSFSLSPLTPVFSSTFSSSSESFHTTSNHTLIHTQHSANNERRTKDNQQTTNEQQTPINKQQTTLEKASSFHQSFAGSVIPERNLEQSNCLESPCYQKGVSRYENRRTPSFSPFPSSSPPSMSFSSPSHRTSTSASPSYFFTALSSGVGRSGRKIKKDNNKKQGESSGKVRCSRNSVFLVRKQETNKPRWKEGRTCTWSTGTSRLASPLSFSSSMPLAVIPSAFSASSSSLIL